MLRLKRKIGQSVVIARDVMLTVSALHLGTPADAAFLSMVSMVHIGARSAGRGGVRDLLLDQGKPLVLELPAGRVAIILEAIERGEALLGFNAPREIEIQRAERPNRRPNAPLV